jgi:autotransporter-associated beta strand protein
LTWDANGAGAGQTDGAGAWLNAKQWWNGATNQTWISGLRAIFGNGGAGGAVTLASPTTVNSLTFNSFSGAYTLGTAGQTITLTAGITKNSGGTNATIASPVTLGAAQGWTNNSSGILTVNTPGVNNGGNLLTVDGSGGTTFGIINNNAVTLTGAGGLTKNGSGTLVMGGTNSSYSGTTTINGGLMRIMAPTTLGTGNLTLNGGVIEHYWSDNFTRALGTGAGQVRILGGVSGFSENGSTSMSVIISNSANYEVVWGSAYFNPSTLVLQAPSAQNSSSLNFQNKLDLNGATRTVQTAPTTGTGAGSATISGVIRTSSGTAGLTKTGGGKLILSAANTYNGGTTVSSGTLTVSASGKLGSGNLTIAAGATGVVQNTSGAIDDSAYVYLNGKLDLAAGVTDKVSRLYFNGVQQASGLWNAARDATHFSGSGSLNVTELPSPWDTQDIGAVGVVGSASYSNSTFTVVGSGTDIQGTADQFRYVYQTGSGDCTIKAKVLSMTNPNGWAKAGVMIRETLNDDAKEVSVLVTPSNGVTEQHRTATGGSTAWMNTGGLVAPYWVRVVRTGDTFVGSRSPDDVTWTEMASTNVSMGASVYIGLAVTSHNNVNTCTATMTNVTAVP